MIIRPRERQIKGRTIPDGHGGPGIVACGVVGGIGGLSKSHVPRRNNLRQSRATAPALYPNRLLAARVGVGWLRTVVMVVAYLFYSTLACRTTGPSPQAVGGTSCAEA